TRFARDWSSDVCSSDLTGRNGRVFPQHPLYFRWIDIVAPSDDQVLSPPLQHVIAIRLSQAQVTRVQPAVVGEGRGRLLRPSPISLTHMRPANLHLTHLAIPQHLARFRVHNTRLHARQR